MGTDVDTETRRTLCSYECLLLCSAYIVLLCVFKFLFDAPALYRGIDDKELFMNHFLPKSMRTTWREGCVAAKVCRDQHTF